MQAIAKLVVAIIVAIFQLFSALIAAVVGILLMIAELTIVAVARGLSAAVASYKARRRDGWQKSEGGR